MPLANPNQRVGVNIGHGGSHAPYDLVVAEADSKFMSSMGSRKRRVAFPLYTDTATIAECKRLVEMELALGNEVIWGVACPAGMTLTQFNAYLAFLASDMIPYAQSLNNPRFRLSYGNEIEYHVDGVTLTVAAMRTAMVTFFSDHASDYGNCSYETNVEFTDEWAGLATNLEWIGFNCYAKNAKDAAFQVNLITAGFPGKGYISEFSTSNGFQDFPNEQDWHDAMAALRVAYLSGGVDIYYFCWRSGSFGLDPNKWEVKLEDGNFRVAVAAVFGVRRWFRGNPNVLITKTRNASKTHSLNRTYSSKTHAGRVSR